MIKEIASRWRIVTIKTGRASVGVQRQWIGRLEKGDNGQVGISMGYVSLKEHAEKKGP